MKKKILVYTCIIGNSDQPAQLKTRESDIDYICFTNNKTITSTDWKIKYIENDGLNDELLSKKYKILGEPTLEKKYETIVYIDGSIQVQKSLSKFINKSCDFTKNSIFFFKHPEKDCVYKEGEELIYQKVKDLRLIQNQLKIYEKKEFPKNYGFVSTSFIIRKSGDNKIKKFLNAWYEQVEKYSKFDQMSVMYSLWKNKISYGKIELNYHDNEHFSLLPYKYNEKVQPDICSFGNGIINELGKLEEENKYEPEKDNYHCNIEDVNDSHSSIARKVKNGSTVLDIGCGVGIIGRLLLENKNCINYGIEIDPVSCARAKNSGYYQDVYNVSIEEPSEYEEFLKKDLTFDYIILADVLEHIKEPCDVLYQLSKLLKPKGKILISIPNAAYIDVIRALINRQFNYQKTGILDSTHFRFFTKESFIEMIDNFNNRYKVNFDIEWFDCTKVNVSYQEDNFANLLNIDNEGTVVQNIFELTKLTENEIPEKLIKHLTENKKDNYAEIENKLNSIEEDKKILNDRIEQLETKVSQLENEKAMTLQEIDKMLNSKSWKVTKPLRKISGILK